jgi:hypothetical protein
MSLRLLQTNLVLVLLVGAGCCLDTGAASTGTSGGNGSSTSSGGTTTGQPFDLDAGTCVVDGGLVVEAGTWLAATFGSCVLCDPTANANGWTYLDAGEACEVMVASSPSARFPTVPVTGRCGTNPNSCTFTGAGDACNDRVGCLGGFCNDAGWCSVDQNLGALTLCGAGPHPNPCAQGLCCLDAGVEGYPDGGGWCCGLIGGGIHACLPSNAVCAETGNCCEGNCYDAAACLFCDYGYGLCGLTDP